MHATESDGVKGKASKIVGWINPMLRAESFPLEDELCGNVQHVVEHSFDTCRAEGGHQDAVYATSVMRRERESRLILRNTDEQ